MGLGGISIKNSLPDTSLETMQDKLLNLKKPFLKSFNPTVESRKDRIRRIVKLIEENSENKALFIKYHSDDSDFIVKLQ